MGPLFYSAVFVAEVMGQTNTTQLFDMNANGGSDQTPAYAVFEDGRFSKMVLMNYMTDPSGANDYAATIYVGGSGWNEPNGVPASVQVKYLRAPSTSEKFNITWAGQVSLAIIRIDAITRAELRADAPDRRSAGGTARTGGGRARRTCRRCRATRCRTAAS